MLLDEMADAPCPNTDVFAPDALALWPNADEEAPDATAMIPACEELTPPPLKEELPSTD